MLVVLALAMTFDNIHIVLASDANYLPGLEVTRATMLAACSVPERLVFHVFDEASLSGLPALQPSNFPVLPLWNESLMPYLRLFLPQLLPEVEWVVYSDVDTIWNRDVCELWDGTTGGGEEGIYWVRDMASMREDADEWISKVAAGEGIAFDWMRYCCSGICVMNLRKMRETDFTRRVLDLYAKYGVPRYPDQDVLNVIFNRDSGLLPSVWGAMGDPSDLPRVGEKCVYHLTGAGRHFHDRTPPTYPPQYLLWWRTRGATVATPIAYRILTRLWWLRGLARALPLRLRERVIRPWFFACVLTDFDKLMAKDKS